MNFNWLFDIFKNISAIGAIIGGLWFLYNHLRSRTFEERLLIDAKWNKEAVDDRRILFVEVVLTNSGRGKLTTRNVKPNGFVYEDNDEHLKYACSLQVKRANTNAIKGNALLDWYQCEHVSTIPGLPYEINLLDDYVVPAKGNEVIFWMEPGDVVHLSATIICEPGHYLLKISFYGADPDEDFWSRLIYANVS